MANKDLSLGPTGALSEENGKLKSNPYCWWYEDKRGIEIYHSVNVNNKFIRTDSFIIPWPSIRAALRRKDK